MGTVASVTTPPDAGPEPRHVVTITRRDGSVSTFTSTRRQATKPRKYEGTAAPSEVSQTGMPAPVSPEMFAALVAGLRAELAAARPIDRERLIRRTATPEAFTGRPWAWSVVTLAEAVPLTGRAKGTLRIYIRPTETSPRKAEKHGGAFREFPPPIASEDREGAARTPARLWEVGTLALWCARRSENMSRAGFARTARGPQKAPKEGPKAGPKRDGTWARSLPRRRIAAIALMRALVREDTAVTLEHATERITAAGLDLAAIDVPSVLMEARRQETAAFITRLESVSVHPRGWVTPEQAGAAFGVKGAKVWDAWRRGELIAAGHGKRGRPLFDPERLRARAIMTRYGWSRVPVDKDWTAPPGLLPPWLSDRSASPRPPGRDT